MPIPQTDPRAGYLAQRAEIDAAVARVLAAGGYILGREVEAFERAFAAWLGGGPAVGVASGTDAITLGLKLLGVGPGQGVVTVSHTAVATVAAIEMAGAAPVLVDVEPEGFTMDPQALEAALATPPLPIGAVVPVHLYGEPADMGPILDIARRAGVPVLEDAAQAHGAAIGGRRAGTFGAAAAFSFYPTKNLGALGDGGAVVVADTALAERARALRQYGWQERYISATPGVNSRLDELQAAILGVKLERLDADNARRIEIAGAYDAGLEGLPLVRPRRRPGTTHVFHQYVVRAQGRERLRERLAAEGIGAAIHYPSPVHLQPAYAGRLPLGPGGLDRTERLCGEILSLPIYPQLEAEAVSRVIAALRSAF